MSLGRKRALLSFFANWQHLISSLIHIGSGLIAELAILLQTRDAVAVDFCVTSASKNLFISMIAIPPIMFEAADRVRIPAAEADHVRIPAAEVKKRSFLSHKKHTARGL